MFAKIFAALLTISGVFLAFGGAVAFATAKPNAPMFFAMLFAIAVFGIGCVIAALGVFRKRRYGFVLCIGLGISAAIFALYVSESFYNQQRLHSSLLYRSPAAFESMHLTQPTVYKIQASARPQAPLVGALRASHSGAAYRER